MWHRSRFLVRNAGEVLFRSTMEKRWSETVLLFMVDQQKINQKTTYINVGSTYCVNHSMSGAERLK
jgi:hypothetical protein